MFSVKCLLHTANPVVATRTCRFNLVRTSETTLCNIRLIRTCTVLGAGGHHDVLCLSRVTARHLNEYREIFTQRWQRPFGMIWIRRGLSYHMNGVRDEESSDLFNGPLQHGGPWFNALCKTFDLKLQKYILNSPTSPLPFCWSGSNQNTTFVDPDCRWDISESVHDRRRRSP